MNLSNSRKTINFTRDIKVFDKHKSWYKVDIDGEFITRNQVVLKSNVVRRKIRRPRMQAEYPDSVIKTHEFIFKMAIQSTVTILLLLVAYSGFAFFTLGDVGHAAPGIGLVEDVAGPVLEIVLE